MATNPGETTLATIITTINDRRRDTSNQSVDMTSAGFRAICSALDIWNNEHDWPFQVKQVEFQYNPGIDTYALDSIVTDFKAPLTLKYFKPWSKTIEFWMVSQARFQSAYLWSRRFAIQVLAGVRTLRVKSIDGCKTSVNTASSYNMGGTWVGSSAISGVYTDQYEGYSMPSSVAFVFNGTTGTLTNDGNIYNTFEPVDLTMFQNRSNLYFDINIPSNTNLTSFSLKWGTDSSDYYQATMTTDYLGVPLTSSLGWTRIKVPWSQPPTTIGTPTISKIKYLQLTITCSGSQNLGLFRFQNVFISENVPLVLTYYSNNMISNAADSNQYQVFQNPANTTDFPLWSGPWDAMTEPFINSCLEIIFFITGEISDYSIIQRKVAELIDPVKKHFPSERRMPTFQIVTDTNYQSNGEGRNRNETSWEW